jgi:hypothetical protein
MMKALFKFFINAKPVELIEHAFSLELSAVGRGLVLIKSKVKPEPNQLVTFDYGFEHKEKVTRFFTGITESITPQGNDVYLLRCVELSYVLHAKIPLVFNFVDGLTILASLSNKTGLKIFHSKAEYWQVEIPSFCSIESGYSALVGLGQSLGVGQLIWQQQTDGSLFVGLPEELPYSNSVFNVDYKVFESIKAENAYAVAMVPGFYPGIEMNGQLVRQVELSGAKMVIKCINK